VVIDVPAVYDTAVTHIRRERIHRTFDNRMLLWLIDVDAPPWHRLIRFDPADHLDGSGETLRVRVTDWLRHNGFPDPVGRIVLLTQPRVLGYTFNPLSLFWCYRADGSLGCVIAEVHNTYGQRHAYLLSSGHDSVDKTFYVSPFLPVEGRYEVRISEPGDRLSVSLALVRNGHTAFVATLRGVRSRARPAVLLRHPFGPHRVAAQIRRHGITVWLRRIPVVRRPEGGIAGRLAAMFRRITGVDLPVGLRAWDGSEAGPPGPPTLVLRSWRALRYLAGSRNELGPGRAYITGNLDVEGDLVEGLRRCHALPARHRSVPLIRRLPEEARPHGRRHSRRRDRAAIRGHYDLGNAFYEEILDPSMAYSCAYWRSAQTLAQAQRDKLDLICRRLRIEPGTRVLDVGCGWGSLLIHAARRGAKIDGITLSGAQAAYARQRIEDLGLTDRATVRVCDYRDLPAETYDAIASIEMAEHVGRENIGSYLAGLRDRLRPGGRLVLQVMSRADGHPGGGPFIERYIAPDMHMRPLAGTIELLARAGFEVCEVEGMRADYARTAAAWADSLEQHYDRVIALVGERRARIWRLYLAGGQLAFADNRMGVDQILAVRR
jgi:cyclopropane-fatty-acyl-phospholipid synthase